MITLLSIVTALLMGTGQGQQRSDGLSLNYQEYVVADTATYVNFRLKVFNGTDSLAYIERAEPSCGCILVTVQRSLVTRAEPGDIYVAITVAKVSVDQPITVDVYTNRNRQNPLRLYIRRRANDAPQPQSDPGHTVRDTSGAVNGTMVQPAKTDSLAKPAMPKRRRTPRH